MKVACERKQVSKVPNPNSTEGYSNGKERGSSETKGDMMPRMLPHDLSRRTQLVHRCRYLLSGWTGTEIPVETEGLVIRYNGTCTVLL